MTGAESSGRSRAIRVNDFAGMPHRPISSFVTRHVGLLLGTMLLVALAVPARSQQASFGPYDADIAGDGPGLRKPLTSESANPIPYKPGTILLWFHSSDPANSNTLIAGMGPTLGGDSIYLGLADGRAILRFSRDKELVSSARIAGPGWRYLAATLQNDIATLYVDGEAVGTREIKSAALASGLELAPVDLPPGETFSHFAGQIRGLEVLPEPLRPTQIISRFLVKPSDSPNTVEIASRPWEIQIKQQAGLTQPQDPSQLPHSNAPFGRAQAQPVPKAGPALQSIGTNLWKIKANWRLVPASQVQGTGAQISMTATDAAPWIAATVPGTVLTTLVDRGVYPDPDFGLNNLAIPESLNKQDYWYRVDFPTPANSRGHRVQLTFNGINYAAEIWLNGKPIGNIKGAFIRGTFDVTDQIVAGGRNQLAVKVSPPPHPGIPHEQSLKGGAGPNGGILCLDGPTFVATEGWDWVPGIRDRDTGIWQDVELSLTGALKLGDPQIVTHLPLPDISSPTSRSRFLSPTPPRRRSARQCVRRSKESMSRQTS